MVNMKIREEAKRCGVCLWMVADALGITDFAFSRKLRKEFPPDERDRVIKIIHAIAAARVANTVEVE